ALCGRADGYATATIADAVRTDRDTGHAIGLGVLAIGGTALTVGDAVVTRGGAELANGRGAAADGRSSGAKRQACRAQGGTVVADRQRIVTAITSAIGGEVVVGGAGDGVELGLVDRVGGFGAGGDV